MGSFADQYWARYHEKLYAPRLSAQEMMEAIKRSRDRRKMTLKTYYDTNKNYLAMVKKEKHECGCGGKYTTNHKAKHVLTKRHQQWEQKRG